MDRFHIRLMRNVVALQVGSVVMAAIQTESWQLEYHIPLTAFIADGCGHRDFEARNLLGNLNVTSLLSRGICQNLREGKIKT